jgi:pimeloyl-ACP methyl ester carboxylesterase
MSGADSRTPHDGRPGSYLQWAEMERARRRTHGRRRDRRGIEDWRRAVDGHSSANAVLIARDNDTREALDIRGALELPKVSLAVSSGGGQRSLWFALRPPQRTSALVLMEHSGLCLRGVRPDTLRLASLPGLGRLAFALPSPSPRVTGADARGSKPAGAGVSRRGRSTPDGRHRAQALGPCRAAARGPDRLGRLHIPPRALVGENRAAYAAPPGASTPWRLR